MKVDFNDLGNQELFELLATLTGMDDSLKEYEEILKESCEDSENDV